MLLVGCVVVGGPTLHPFFMLTVLCAIHSHSYTQTMDKQLDLSLSGLVLLFQGDPKNNTLSGNEMVEKGKGESGVE